MQFLVLIAFYFAYNITRGLADRDVSRALENGREVAGAEERLGLLFEPSLQNVLDASVFLTSLTAWTYWLSQFVVVGAVLVYVYLRHHERFASLRNWLVLANTTGLVCYALIPTAPPRMFTDLGFTDTLARASSVDHDTVGRLANEYAAMPSLHAMDAFIVSVVMLAVVRRPLARLLWLAWPAWVSFALMATANHYWLDVATGIAIAIVAAFALRPSRISFRIPSLAARRTAAREAR
jgi:membrane-associated phospholipid phosphatase